MKIEAGKYYRTRGGQVTGPIEKSLTNSRFMHYNEDGTFRYGPTRSPFDLISEVYVSDTPPADGANKFQNFTIGTYAPETKTLRDEFAGYALIGLTAAGGDLADCGRDEIAKEAWRQADAMMEARKK